MNSLRSLPLLALVLAAVLPAAAQTPKTRTDLYTEINTLFADEGGTAITPEDVRTSLKNITASSYNGLTDGAPSTTYQPLDAELTAVAGLTSAANKVPYYTGSGTAALADLSAAGRALVDDADASAQRTTLGLAPVAASGSASDLSTGTIPDARLPATLPAASGVNLTALNASNLASGTVANARLDAELQALAGLTSAADKVPYFDGSGTATVADLTAAGRALLDDADASAQRTTLGLAAVAASGSASDLSSGTIPDARLPATLPAASGVNLTALNASNLASGTVANARLDTELQALAGLTSAANKVPYFDGSGTATVADLTAAGRALLDDADASAQRTTLGLAAVASSGSASDASYTPTTAGNWPATPPSTVLAALDYLSAYTSAMTGFEISYTGTPVANFVIGTALPVVVLPTTVGNGSSVQYRPTAGKAAVYLSYFEGAGTGTNQLLTLSFDDLEYINTGALQIVQCSALTSLSFPELVAISSGSLVVGTHPALTTFSIPNLAYTGIDFIPTTMAALTTLSAPSLISVGRNFGPTTMGAVTTWNFPALVYVGGNFAPNTMGALTSLSCNALQQVGGTFSVASMASLTTASFSGMVSYGSTITMNSGLGALTSVTLGTIGTLKSINGATINISGQALTSANVNAILALLVSLDGTNGTTTWGSGKTLNVSGGSSGAPTGQGATDKSTLQARGATITTN